MIEAKIDKKAKTITVTLPLEKPGTRSASGKTEIVASTRGNQPIAVDNETIYFGVNIYKK